jgi:hypothetical protein
MRFSSPKTGSFPSYQKQALLINEESLWNTFKKVFEGVCTSAVCTSAVCTSTVCTSTVLVFPDPLSPLPPTSAATRTPEGTEEGTELTDEGDTYMEYSSQCLHSPSTGAITKITWKNSGQHADWLIIQSF